VKALRLGVNIDHVATVRNARGGDNPDPVRAARLAETSLARANCKRRLTVVSPMPRLGVLTMRSKARSSSSDWISRK